MQSDPESWCHSCGALSEIVHRDRDTTVTVHRSNVGIDTNQHERLVSKRRFQCGSSHAAAPSNQEVQFGSCSVTRRLGGSRQCAKAAAAENIEPRALPSGKC
jgi:hypothetical protein